MAISGGAGLPAPGGLPKGIAKGQSFKGTTLPRGGKGVSRPLQTIPRSLPSSLPPLAQTPRPAAPGAPSTGGAAPSGGATTPAASASPLDATYFANVAANNAKVNGQIAALNQANSYGSTDLQAALQKLATAEPQNQLKLEQNANRQGALYSSVYAQNAGNLASQYAQQQAQLQQANARQTAARNSQIGMDQQDENDYAIQQALAAAGRASAAAGKDPTLGQAAATNGVPAAAGGLTAVPRALPSIAKGRTAGSLRTIPRAKAKAPVRKGVPLRPATGGAGL